MVSFTYYVPTKVFFGTDAESHIGSFLKSKGFHKVLLHYGSGSIKKNGLYDKVTAELQQAGIAYVELPGVEPNPKIGLVRCGVELCRKEGVDFLLGVGGGSVSDSCKAIALGLALDIDPWEAVVKNICPEKPFPMGLVLTIAAAGSEMSNSCVITDDEHNLKRGCNHDGNRPLVAFMNPENTLTVPKYQTAAGTVDIMMHTMERYFNMSENMELTDGISEALIKTVMKHSKILKEHPDCYESRAEVMWASSLSHNDLTGCGTDGGDWACHQLEHEIGGMFDVAHGAGLAAVWGSWARYVYKARPERFAKFARNIFNIQETDDEKAAVAGIEAMENYYRSVGMPTSLCELGIHATEEQIKEMADKCSFYGKRTVGVMKKIGAPEAAEIYRMANDKSIPLYSR